MEGRDLEVTSRIRVREPATVGVAWSLLVLAGAVLVGLLGAMAITAIWPP